jgi:hypothetical protein
MTLVAVEWQITFDPGGSPGVHVAAYWSGRRQEVVVWVVPGGLVCRWSRYPGETLDAHRLRELVQRVRALRRELLCREGLCRCG